MSGLSRSEYIKTIIDQIQPPEELPEDRDSQSFAVGFDAGRYDLAQELLKLWS